jgi:hypothetical protein
VIAFQPTDHDLVIRYGDCEFWHYCSCGHLLGVSRPDQPLEMYARDWERHAMTAGAA